MQQKIWNRIKEEFKIWRVGAFPGLLIIAFVVAARLTGSLQFLELITFDALMRLRPTEPVDEKIVIVGINEEDIQRLKEYPIADKNIALLINKLQKHNPKVIGLDIIRDKPVNPGNQQLEKLFKQNNNIVGIEKVLPPYQISASPQLPPERIGFADVISDIDGKSRRILLGTKTSQGYKFSFPLRLAEAYLAPDAILENGKRDSKTMRFKSTEIPRFTSNAGGYVKEDDSGLKTLLNFRSGNQRFKKLSFQDIINDKFHPNLIKNNIVIIGITAESVPDFVNTSAVGETHRGRIYGAEFHAHAASQILNAVLNNRALLQTLSDEWEYIWIICWGIIAISLGRKFDFSLFKSILAVFAAGSILIATGYTFLVLGWWLPVAPVLLILLINVELSAFSFYKHEQAIKESLKIKIAVQERTINIRENTIRDAFSEIHNGPLQILAALMRDANHQNLSQKDLNVNLQQLNTDIRDVLEYLQLEAINNQESLRLGTGKKIDLKRPLHELFYEVYSNTVERNFIHFKTLKVKARDFETIDEKYLNIEQKRELCQFLEEALCNVGKHAKYVKRLSAIGKFNEGYYTLSIKDNGTGITCADENQGTKSAIELSEKLLNGKFSRKSISPQGTLCELTWCLSQNLCTTNKFADGVKVLFKHN